jgi:protein gp37
MSDNSAIEWTDATWTPIRARNLKTGKVGWYCEHATTGCEFCYAEGMNKRLGTGLPFKPGHRKDVEIFLDEKMLLLPLRWKKPRMIFVCSMTDLFADFVPDESIDKMFAVIALTPQHTYQVLTKRAERMREYFQQAGLYRRVLDFADSDLRRLYRKLGGIGIGNPATSPLRNVWLGVSAERQQEADERIPLLLDTPAAVRFISAEPLLGPIDLTEWLRDGHPTQDQVDGPYGMHYLRHSAPRFDWLIVGGESSPSARPMHPDWARSLRDQCAAAGVAFFFKQWGEWGEYEAGDKNWTSVANKPDCTEFLLAQMTRLGKQRAGRLLDGIEHNAMPQVST